MKAAILTGTVPPRQLTPFVGKQVEVLGLVPTSKLSSTQRRYDYIWYEIHRTDFPPPGPNKFWVAPRCNLIFLDPDSDGVNANVDDVLKEPV